MLSKYATCCSKFRAYIKNAYLCTRFFIGKRVAILAQLVEQFTRNEQVVGSSPMDGSRR